MHELLVEAEHETRGTHLVLEQLPERLYQLEAHGTRQPSDVVVALDHGRRTPDRSRFDHVGVERTLSQEVDFEILERDYEDELTATQALNAEIAKAAEELANDVDGFEDDDATAETPLATVTELDITAQLPAENDDEISDLDDTGINEEITERIEAVEKTVEMVVGEPESTVELQVESGKVDTKAG